MSELDEIRQRLTALETQVSTLHEEQAESRRAADLFAMVDRDVADISETFSAQRRVLQALRDTQMEHGKTLLEQGKMLGGLVVDVIELKQDAADVKHTLGEQGSVLAEHSSMLAEQGSVLAEQGSVLAEHSSMLAEQGSVLAEHSSMLAEQGSVLAEQTNLLGVIASQLEQHGRILARLDPEVPETDN